MSSVLMFVVAAVGGLVLLMVVLNMTIMWRMTAQQGKPVPEIPGPVGQRLASAKRGLVYFFSPACGACLRLTPKFKSLSAQNEDVHVVDVTQDYAVARALKVLATPSTVEVADGRIVGVHVGLVPDDVLARFAAQA